MYSNASFSTGPLGGAPAAIGSTISAPSASATSMKPPRQLAVPR
jgi:hypothetical protein